MLLYFKKYLKLHFLLLFLLILYGGIVPIFSLATNFIINAIVLLSADFNNQSAINLIIIWSCVAVVCALLQPFVVYYLNCLVIKISYLIGFDLRIKIINSIQTYKWLEFNQKGSDTFLGWLLNDVILLQNDILREFYSNFISVSVVFFGLIFLIIIDYVYFIYFGIGIVVALIFIISPIIFKNFIKKATKNYLNSKNTFSNKLTNFLFGYQLFLFANKANLLTENVAKVCLTMQNKEMIYYFKSNSQSLTNQTVSSILNTAIIVGGIFLALNNFVTFGSLIAASQILMQITNNSSTIVTVLARYKANKKLLSKSYDSLQKDGKTQLLPSAINKIEFSNVNFNFDNKTILNNFSYTFLNNQKYALIASSGKGKSTLMRLLLGVYDDYEGSIKINDIEVKNINSESLFNQIGYVTNETNLLPGTAQDNILFYNQNFNKEKLNISFEKAQLSKEISLNDDVEKLSKGQQQRVILARLFYSDKSLWILDEATANLDKKNRDIIEQEIIKNPNRLVIIISHNFDDSFKTKFDHVLKL